MEDDLHHFEVRINPNEPVFIITVVSEIVRIPVWTLRKLDEMGIVCAKRLGKKTRCYSQRQVQILNYIHHLMETKKVNLHGIKIILEIEDRLE